MTPFLNPSRSDETLLQENARLVRRIQYLEGILLSLKHPATLTEDQRGDPASPSQKSQSSEMLPSSDVSDPMTTHRRDASDLVVCNIQEPFCHHIS